MKLCPSCERSPLAFSMVAMITLVIGFVTWLMLDFSGFDSLSRTLGALVMALAVGSGLLLYVMRCLRRHCQHG
ncbi:MAG: hypothetical protein JXM75_09270 [Chromatiaceae bacterium]|nr:hypothetical protein [Chromatiaceae bacterium]